MVRSEFYFHWDWGGPLSSIGIQKNHTKVSVTLGRLHTNVWNRRGISLQTKMKVYRAVVFPTLPYACEMWTQCCLELLQALGVRVQKSVDPLQFKINFIKLLTIVQSLEIFMTTNSQHCTTVLQCELQK